MSFKCCGIRPSGLPDEPGLNEFIDLLTSFLSTRVVSDSSFSIIEELGCFAGCFSLNFYATEAEGESTELFEARILTAPEMSA